MPGQAAPSQDPQVPGPGPLRAEAPLSSDPRVMAGSCHSQQSPSQRFRRMCSSARAAAAWLSLTCKWFELQKGAESNPHSPLPVYIILAYCSARQPQTRRLTRTVWKPSRGGGTVHPFLCPSAQPAPCLPARSWTGVDHSSSWSFRLLHGLNAAESGLFVPSPSQNVLRHWVTRTRTRAQGFPVHGETETGKEADWGGGVSRWCSGFAPGSLLKSDPGWAWGTEWGVVDGARMDGMQGKLSRELPKRDGKKKQPHNSVYCWTGEDRVNYMKVKLLI